MMPLGPPIASPCLSLGGLHCQSPWRASPNSDTHLAQCSAVNCSSKHWLIWTSLRICLSLSKPIKMAKGLQCSASEVGTLWPDPAYHSFLWSCVGTRPHPFVFASSVYFCAMRAEFSSKGARPANLFFCTGTDSKYLRLWGYFLNTSFLAVLEF
jgi:hypothetical protein